MTQEGIQPFRVLFIADGSLDRPLLHSQGIPLLKRLSKRGVTCYIQSFESNMESTKGELGSDLARHNITWLPVIIDEKLSNWQRLRMIVSGFFEAFKLCRREKIDVIHCRSYRPGVMGSLIKIFTGSGFLFDMRGFLIDEQLMLGRWKASGIKYKLARLIERWSILNADALITTSPQFREKVLELPYYPRKERADLVISIANCADTLRFPYPHPLRREIRTKMGWDGRLVIAFAGEAQTWEGFDDIYEFFKVMQSANSAAYLALFAYGDLTNLRRMLSSRGLNLLDYCLNSVPSAQMPDYLGASDVGVVFRRANPFTQTIASPIKFAEYLSSGLPVVINPGIGDTSRIVHQYKVGIVVDPNDSAQLKTGASTLLEILATDQYLRQRCHDTAQVELSLDLAQEEYFHAYQLVAEAAKKRTQI